MSVYLLKIPRCVHILDTGFRCGSPSLKGQPFCYHHHDVHAARPQVGNKGYRFRPLETPKSVTLQLADIAQAAHDGAISLQLARLLLYYVQLGAPYVSKSTGYSGDVETELTPAMAALPRGTDIPVRESRVVPATIEITTAADACRPERGQPALSAAEGSEPKDPFGADPGNPAQRLPNPEPVTGRTTNATVMASSINNNRSPNNSESPAWRGRSPLKANAPETQQSPCPCGQRLFANG